MSTPCHETHRQLALDANVAPSIRALTRVLLQILVDARVELVPFLILGFAGVRKRFQHTIYSAHFLDPEAILLRPIDVATPLLPVLGTGEVARGPFPRRKELHHALLFGRHVLMRFVRGGREREAR